MKRKASHDTGVYKYLQSLGVLDQPPEVIEHFKLAYWNMVKRQWKRERSQKQKSFTVSFTKAELKDIAEASTLHNMSRTRFIKQASLAYVHKKYLVPDLDSIHSIKTALSLNYSALQEMYELEKVPAEVGIELQQRMEILEQMVLQQLMHPKPIGNDH